MSLPEFAQISEENELLRDQLGDLESAAQRVFDAWNLYKDKAELDEAMVQLQEELRSSRRSGNDRTRSGA